MFSKDISDTTSESGIYSIYCITSDTYYIGSSVKIKNRLHRHNRDLIANRHANPHLQNSWNKYGANDFKIIILEVLEFTDTKSLNIREAYWIAKMPKVFNVIKNPLDLRGPNHPNYGKKNSEETKRKRVESRGPFKHTPESKAKLSAAAKKRVGALNPFYGKKHSAETRAKMSENHSDFSGEKNPAYGKDYTKRKTEEIK